jgi:hypothetical protein
MLSRNPSPPAGRGRGKGEGADDAVYGATHLTLHGTVEPGPLPLPQRAEKGQIAMPSQHKALRLAHRHLVAPTANSLECLTVTNERRVV